jgi:hypothetical protein
VKDENGDLLADVHSVSDARKTGIHTAELLVPDPSSLEFEIAIAKLNNYKSPGCGQIPAGSELYSLRSINPLILFGARKNYLINGRSLLVYQVIIMG